MNRLFRAVGHGLAAYLLAPRPHGAMVATVAPELLEATLRPGDVLLVEGESRISMAIKMLTQSNWSHAALFVGHDWPGAAAAPEARTLIEADLRQGVRAVSLGSYAHMHTRICRPVGLAAHDVEQLVGYVVGRLGQGYDLKNLVDLARYLLPAPPVPLRWRRRMIAFGSGDPSRAICSTLIAEAFQSIRYPILPEITLRDTADGAGEHCRRELLHIRHHSLYVPKDFDMSPYFDVVKPTLRFGFDPNRLAWDDAPNIKRERR
ncbi:MAG: lipo-like protein [Rhodoferax sp.]|nr:lipo-like protein [Rhodoferax sp.]